jgi:hypothetical protein
MVTVTSGGPVLSCAGQLPEVNTNRRSPSGTCSAG